MTRKLIPVSALASTLVLLGCTTMQDERMPTYGTISGTTPYTGAPSSETVPYAASGTGMAGTASAQAAQYGYVRNIEQRQTAQRSSGAGAILGAVGGGVLGSQMGSGTGRAAATAGGAVGGAMAGNNEIERNRNIVQDNPQTYYQVEVRLDNGDVKSFDYADLSGLRVGDRVRVQDNQLQRW